MRLTPSATRDLLDRHGIAPAKRLGQHFLIDPNVVDRIVKLVNGRPGDPVVEIGAGLGTLTRALAEAGYEVLAYEVDERLRGPLMEVVGDRATIRIENAAAVDLGRVLDTRRWRLAANLPYNVGTPIVLDALRHVPQIVRFIVMLQAEVVDRMAAGPGRPEYGLPSVVVGLHSTIVERFTVPPHLFYPRPAVESSVVVLDRIEPSPWAEAAIALATRAFGQRRKMLRSSLREAIHDSAFDSAGIDPTRRPEELAPDEWIALAEAAA